MENRRSRQTVGALVPSSDSVEGATARSDREAGGPKTGAILDYLARHQDGDPVYLKDLARAVGGHPDYVSRRLRAILGMPFREFRLRRRVHRAIALMKMAPDRPLKEIAYDTGFGSPQSFSKAFKRVVGCSPRAFRTRRSPQARS